VRRRVFGRGDGESRPPGLPARTLVALVVAAALPVLAVGCGGDGDTAATPTAKSGLPSCAKAGAAVERPSELADDLPLPPGTVITSSEGSTATQLVIGGVIPRDIRGAATFFADELPAAGYPLGEGDSEPDEAESTFSGKGYQGKWKVNGILNCPEAVTLTLTLTKAQ
jgi:hypothetical protein